LAKEKPRKKKVGGKRDLKRGRKAGDLLPSNSWTLGEKKGKSKRKGAGLNFLGIQGGLGKNSERNGTSYPSTIFAMAAKRKVLGRPLNFHNREVRVGGKKKAGPACESECIRDEKSVFEVA